MMMNRPISLLSLPVLLILIGTGYLLFNAGLLQLTPWQIAVQYWPVLFIYFGLKYLAIALYRWYRVKLAPAPTVLLNFLLIFFGLFLLAPRFGWHSMELSWGLIWPLLLILLGLGALLGGRNSLITIDSDKKARRYGTPLRPVTALVGEIHRGASPWALEDMQFRQAIGEIHLDLTQAVIPNREVKLDISGLIGEVRVYVPADLPVKAMCQTNIGEITIFDRHDEHVGSTRVLSYVTPGYEEAERKLFLRTSLRIGEIKVRQIG